MRCPTSGLGSRLRRWIEGAIWLLLVGLAVRTWFVEGLVGACPVAGGSMAETLLGVHREVTCADCGHRFVCGADLRPVGARAVCPNCGYAGNDLAARPDLSGDRVLIDKAIFQFRPPRRWEVVVFRDPQQASRTLVKRVVGLPGESIQIRHGDVYVDGQIVRKTLAQQRALAVLVYDADCRPTIAPASPARWRGGPDSQWIASGGRFAHPSGSGDTTGDDWLEYHHASRVPAAPGEIREGPVTDLCGYNQTRPRRNEDVHPVADLLVSLRLSSYQGRGRLLLRATDGRDEFQAQIDPRLGRWQVVRNGQETPEAAGRLELPTGGLSIELSLIDRQFLLAFDGRPAAVLACRESDPPPEPPSRPLAIGCQGGLGAEICELRVYRDVFYTHPIGVSDASGLDKPYRLGEDQYYVLGDNSPISEDSRTWARGAGVDAKWLVGKPLVVHFPSRLVEWGRWRFQVPDLGRIRYIR